MEFDQIKYKQSASDIQEVCGEIRDLLISKNESYGDSALNPKRIFSRADLMEQLNVRLDDKLSRLAFGRGDLIPEDIELDIMGYLILRRIARKRAREADQEALKKVPLARGGSQLPDGASQTPNPARIEVGGYQCNLPPQGWSCSRAKGHEGPCAASPVGKLQDLENDHARD